MVIALPFLTHMDLVVVDLVEEDKEGRGVGAVLHTQQVHVKIQKVQQTCKGLTGKANNSKQLGTVYNSFTNLMICTRLYNPPMHVQVVPQHTNALQW